MLEVCLHVDTLYTSSDYQVGCAVDYLFESNSWGEFKIEEGEKINFQKGLLHATEN